MQELNKVVPHVRLGNSSKRTRCAKDAWARYIRDRWPRNTQDEVRAEWGLTEWQARSVVYGEISQATEDLIFRHKNGGALLALDLLLVRFNIGCNDLANHLDKEAEDARNRLSADLERNQGFARRLAGHQGRASIAALAAPTNHAVRRR